MHYVQIVRIGFNRGSFFCLVCACARVSGLHRKQRKIIEAEFLGFDKATQIVKLRLRDGREQNVKLDLFSAESQQWIKSGGQSGQQGDDPFGDADDPWGKSDWEWLFDGRSLNGWEGDTNVWRVHEGTLHNTGRGNLFTTKQYDNFIIQLRFRCEQGADNGLVLRVDDAARQDVSRAMEIQIADDRGDRLPNHNGTIHGTLTGPKPVIFFDGITKGR